MGFLRGLAVFFGLLGVISCGRSPQSYLERGNKFSGDHKYQDASIQYRKAIQRDPKFGEAFYRLGLSESAEGNFPEAYRYLSRAVELMPDNQEAKIKLADLALMMYWANPRKPKAPYEQLARLADQLLAKDPNSFDGLRLRGSLAMLDRRPKEAIEYFGKANQIKPMQPGLVTEYVQALMADGQWPQAEALARQLIHREKTFKPIYDVLYSGYLRLNRAGDAEALLKEKVANNPTDPDAILQLAGYYRRAGKDEPMQAALQRLAGNPKTFPKGHLLAGQFFGQFGDWDKAIQEFQACERNPADKLTCEKAIVNALMAQGKFQDASARLESLSKQYPEDLEMKAVQASAWLLSGRPSQIQASIAQLRELSKRKPNDVNIRMGLAQAHRAAQDWNSAKAEFQEVLKINRGNIDARLDLAEIGLAQEKPNESLRYVDQILSVDPANRKARLIRAAALSSTGNYEGAHRELNLVLQRSPQDREAQIQLGTLAILEKRFKDAEKVFGNLQQGKSQDVRSTAGLVDTYMAESHYDKAMQLLIDELKDSRNPALVRSLLANTATQAGRYDVALEQFKELLALQPNSPDVYMRMAKVHQLQGDRSGMIADLEKAKRLAPQDVLPVVSLATLLQQSGRLQDAKANYERVLELQPDNVVALNNLAYLLAETGGNLERALRLAQQAQQKQPGVVTLADTLGWIYLKMNLQDSAFQIFRSNVSKQPDNATFRYHLGLALLQKGDKSAARTELQTALTKRPAKDEELKIRETLARIG